MKQLLRLKLGVLALLLGMGTTYAEIVSIGSTIQKEGYGPYYLYPEFTYDGKTQIYMEVGNSNSSDPEKIAIYDEAFRHIKTLNVPTCPAVTAKYSYQNAVHGPVGVSIGGTFEYEMARFPSVDDVYNYIDRQWEEVKENGEIRFYYNGPSSEFENFYLCYEGYGKKYPKNYYLVKETGLDGQEKYCLMDVVVEYNSEGYGFVCYGEPEEKTETITPGYIELDIQTDYSRDLDSAPVTQTLFNSDEAYEFIVSDYSLINYNVENEDYKATGKYLAITGFKVVSENGNTVATMNFPSGMYGYGDPQLFITSAGNFLIVVLNNDSGERFVVTYKVENSGSGIRQIGSPVQCGMKVNPTAPTRGSLVNVSFAPAESGTRLNVVGTDGRCVFQCALDEGVTSSQIETGRFSSGIYVVVLEDSKGTRESCKIIIR